MGPKQARINREAASVTDPKVPLTDLPPELFVCIVTWPLGSAHGADETASALVAVGPPVNLFVARQATHRLGKGDRPDSPEREIAVWVRIIDSPFGDAVLATRPRIICPWVHSHSVRLRWSSLGYEQYDGRLWRLS
jgi:hypothetical protein